MIADASGLARRTVCFVAVEGACLRVAGGPARLIGG